jgi:AN1-type zinc finger protein 2
MELLDKGKHCNESYCNQFDFLPIKCLDCKNFYCKEHFKPSTHKCKYHVDKDFKLPVCSLCNKVVKCDRNHDIDLCLAKHMQDCDLDDHKIIESKSTKSKCSYLRCKIKDIILFDCDKCNKKYCVKHRFQDDHKCNGDLSCAQEYRRANVKSSQLPFTIQFSK